LELKRYAARCEADRDIARIPADAVTALEGGRLDALLAVELSLYAQIEEENGRWPEASLLNLACTLLLTSKTARPMKRSENVAVVDAVDGSTRRISMDWNQVEGNWKQLKGKVKEQWGKLTDDDLDVIAGKRDQLEGKLQERYGYAKYQATKDVNDWYDRQTW
jgi:uncharacterized protein YjbJ (UPF0337 family)